MLCCCMKMKFTQLFALGKNIPRQKTPSNGPPTRPKIDIDICSNSFPINSATKPRPIATNPKNKATKWERFVDVQKVVASSIEIGHFHKKFCEKMFNVIFYLTTLIDTQPFSPACSLLWWPCTQAE